MLYNIGIGLVALTCILLLAYLLITKTGEAMTRIPWFGRKDKK